MTIALSSLAAFTATVAAARSVDFAAYTLRAGVVRDALVAAAREGVRVRVRLERDPLDDAARSLHAANAQSVALLAAAGADAAVTGTGLPVAHLKAAVVDGVAWLDDRNWAGDGPETLLRDSDPGDVAAVSAALEAGPGAGVSGAGGPGPGTPGGGDSGGDGRVQTTKGAAQAREIALIRAAGATPVDVESESFGSGGVYAALLARGRAGLPTRLLVAGREAMRSDSGGAAERHKLAKLAALGVAVRTGSPRGADFDEKLALAGPAAWAGSANATYARGAAGEQSDWGLTTRVPEVVDGLRAEFERNWRAAVPLTDAESPD
jgi:hypothetical protein